MLVLLSRLSTWINLLFVLLYVVSQISSIKRSPLKICKHLSFSLLNVQDRFTVTVTVSDPVSASLALNCFSL